MQSMTGYGRCQAVLDGREMTLEVKTVNHRFLDLSFRLPRSVGFLEEMLRRELASGFQRGHMDVFVAYRNTRSDARQVRVDAALAGAYMEAARQVQEIAGAGEPLSAAQLMALPDVVQITEAQEDQGAVEQLAKLALEQVTTQVRAMRAREGDALRRDLTEHLDALAQLRERMAARAPQVPQAYRERLTARLAELAVEPVEPQRLAQEVAIFADKCAIDEELSRLASHIAQMRACLDEDGAVGRRLDFLTQEMNREVNTIGSKASDLEITQAVVAAKSEIEKLREQVQNVE